jgi:hypothetical protein
MFSQGDTLFVGSVGRTDFPGSSMKKTERSGHTLHRYNLKFVARVPLISCPLYAIRNIQYGK